MRQARRAGRRPRQYRGRRGGIYTMKNPDYVEWRNLVLERCGRRCMLCGVKQKKRLHCHHIKKKSDFPELGLAPMNGVPLCKRCHMKIVDRRETVFEELFLQTLETNEPVPYPFFVHYNSVLMNKPPVRCGCGCGQVTRFARGRYRQYLAGHAAKPRPRELHWYVNDPSLVFEVLDMAKTKKPQRIARLLNVHAGWVERVVAAQKDPDLVDLQG